ncbi:7-ethoxycoumarin O-deethylase [Lactuca sativa]|uniref:Cytochrome P450 n=1 Tax=Lactuca sativa TaxID=4236 RepID=A0A9R1WAS4_LACSA|nr:7-ethoxycoumarin O-deethylase [Lactuca sativa]KAJ0219236.1 hypothetical protein LSAT_V11C300106040 [Lactuca sativa]
MIVDSWWSWWSEVTSKKVEMLTFPVLTLSAISIAILVYISRKTRSRLPPGPRGLPVVGYLPFLGANLLDEFTKMGQRFGPIFKLQLGSKTYVVISSSDLAKVVLRDQDDTFANRDPPVAGIALTYGGKDITWSDNNNYLRNMRKVLMYEVMSHKNLEASLSFRRGGVRKTVKNVYETMGTEVDIGETAFSTLLRVITSIIWGKSFDEDEASNTLMVGFREVITNAMMVLGTNNVSDYFPVLARFDLQGVERKMKKEAQKLDGIFQKIIDDRVISLKTKESAEQQGRKDLLQVFLELKQENNESSFTDTQIKALFMDFFVAGTHTTTTVTECTMMELLKNPDIMKKIQDELEQVVGLNNIVEESHLPNLPYLDATIKETFRLHPTLPLLVTRSPNKSCKVDKYTVPKGSNVFLNVWAIQRDPKYWDNPLEFNPNRFLNHDGTTNTKFDYNGLNTNFLAFGAGRRRCPGVPLSEKMLMYLLASLLHSFNWTLPDVKEHEMSEKLVPKKQKSLIAIPSQRLPAKKLYI